MYFIQCCYSTTPKQYTFKPDCNHIFSTAATIGRRDKAEAQKREVNCNQECKQEGGCAVCCVIIIHTLRHIGMLLLAVHYLCCW